MPNSITPPPHLLKKFSTEARDESNKRNGTGYLKTFAKLCIEWANSKSTSNDRQIRSSEITPPPELVQQWEEQFLERPTINGCFIQSYIAAKAAQWGADQELEACCEWLEKNCGRWEIPASLRATRRPKPPSLKEQALLQLDTLNADLAMHGRGCDLSQIRRALEALDA
jgi:hypothetical protein